MSIERVLFLCTGNSCRSQMAEGWGRHLHGGRLEFESAGIEQHGLNPRAVQVMAEVGVDISHHRSECLEDLEGDRFDWVITVCGHAHETCPVFPGQARVIHRGFDDPPALSRELTDEEAVLNCYRRVRDEIGAYVAGLPEILASRD